jgi:chromosome partitioning protein
MAQFLAVANRKGGVGKSTIAVMLAHAAAVLGGQRVLLMDLDSQCNASLILMGGQGWNEARKARKSIADYLFDMFDESALPPRDYLLHGVGDVLDLDGKRPTISILPGSLLLEDVQGELYVKEARQSKDPSLVANRVRGKLERLLRQFESIYDLVILDCAPGLSFAALAALKTADHVLVPFRPDYVSQLAVDQVALLIEGRRNSNDLAAIPMDQRRYVGLANSNRGIGRDRLIIEEISLNHPVLETQIPHSDAIANAFDWDPTPKRLDEKYGDGIEVVQRLFTELMPRLVGRRAAA